MHKNLIHITNYYRRDENNNKACSLGHKEPFLFVEDMSHNYVSGLENRGYYRCFCLECGRFDDYQMSVQDWRLVIKIEDIDYSTASINHIRERYFELLNTGLTNEEAVSMLNKSSKTKKLEKLKK